MRILVLSLLLSPGWAPPRAAAQKTFEWGFEQRVRNENWENIFDFDTPADDQRVQIRWRTRLWMKAPLGNAVEFHAGLNQETNQIVTPDRHNRFDEVIFETACVHFKKLGVEGLSLRAGRQNLVKGEGFLLLDGTPWDGSRTLYMNAAVLGYTRGKSTVELIGISDPWKDRYLPRFHNQSKMLVDWDEQALGAYLTSKEWASTTVESYYFFKKEFRDRRAPDHPQFQPDRGVHTAGGRVAHNVSARWTATGEYARQWGGDQTGAGIQAWGGYSYLTRKFGRDGQHYVRGGYWGMSGDDPDTPGKIEGWDPLFARWPKWSELYIYTQIREKAAGYWTNTSLWQGELGLRPWKPLGVRTTYYKMGAYHRFAGDPGLYARGTDRGHQFQVRADVTAGKHWQGHALYERMWPGDYYVNPSKAWFLRFEVIFQFTGTPEF